MVFILCQGKLRQACLLYSLTPFPSLLIHVSSFSLHNYIATPLEVFTGSTFPPPFTPTVSLNVLEKTVFNSQLPATSVPTYFQLLYFGKLDSSKLTNLILLFFQLGKDPKFFLFQGKTSFTIFK